MWAETVAARPAAAATTVSLGGGHGRGGQAAAGGRAQRGGRQRGQVGRPGRRPPPLHLVQHATRQARRPGGRQRQFEGGRVGEREAGRHGEQLLPFRDALQRQHPSRIAVDIEGDARAVAVQADGAIGHEPGRERGERRVERRMGRRRGQRVGGNLQLVHRNRRGVHRRRAGRQRAAAPRMRRAAAVSTSLSGIARRGRFQILSVRPRRLPSCAITSKSSFRMTRRCSTWCSR
jgi:hypothetical protein